MRTARRALPPLLLPLLLVPLLGGCLSSGDYPSLARRPIETLPDDPPPAPPVAAAALDPADAATVDRLVAQHRAAAARFDGLANAAGRVATGAVGSESWSLAEIAISRAAAARAPSTDALVELDRLYLRLLDAESQGGAPGPADAVATARFAVASDVAAQAALLSRLAARTGD